MTQRGWRDVKIQERKKFFGLFFCLSTHNSHYLNWHFSDNFHSRPWYMVHTHHPAIYCPRSAGCSRKNGIHVVRGTLTTLKTMSQCLSLEAAFEKCWHVWDPLDSWMTVAPGRRVHFHGRSQGVYDLPFQYFYWMRCVLRVIWTAFRVGLKRWCVLYD